MGTMDAEVAAKARAIAVLKRKTGVTLDKANVNTDLCFVSKEQEYGPDFSSPVSKIGSEAVLKASKVDESLSTVKLPLLDSSKPKTWEVFTENVQVKQTAASPRALNYEECSFEEQSEISIKTEETQKPDQFSSLRPGNPSEQNDATVGGGEPPFKVIKKKQMLEACANENHVDFASPSSLIVSEALSESLKSSPTVPVNYDCDSDELTEKSQSQVKQHVDDHDSAVRVRSFKKCARTSSKINEVGLENRSNVSELSLENQKICWIKEEQSFESQETVSSKNARNEISLENGLNVSEFSLENQEICWIKEEPSFESQETVSSKNERSLEHQAGTSWNLNEPSMNIQIGAIWSINERSFEDQTVHGRTLSGISRNDRNLEDQERTSSEQGFLPGCTGDDFGKSSPSCPAAKSLSIHTQHSRVCLDEPLKSRSPVGVEKLDSGNGVENELSCSHCQKKFSLPADWIVHSAGHSTKNHAAGAERCRNSSCSCCGKQVKRWLEKPYPCTQCTKRFFDVSALKRHEKAHRQPHVCALCSATFKLKVLLVQHLKRRHSDDNPFVCKQCPFRFKTASSLRNHSKAHRKRFPCSLCPTSFSRAGGLQRHMTKHSEERPFSCPVCLKTFKSKDHLGKHQHEVHSEKVFSCALCPLKLKNAKTLRQHQRLHKRRRPAESPECLENFSFKEAVEQCSSTNALRDIGLEKTFYAPSFISQSPKCSVENQTRTWTKTEGRVETDATNSVSVNEFSLPNQTISSKMNGCSVGNAEATSSNTVEGNMEIKIESIPTESSSDNNDPLEQHEFENQDEGAGSRRAFHILSLTSETQNRSVESQAETSLVLSDSSLQNEVGIIWPKSEGGLENRATNNVSVNKFSLRNQTISSNTNGCSVENAEGTTSNTVEGNMEIKIESLSTENSSDNNDPLEQHEFENQDEGAGSRRAFHILSLTSKTQNLSVECQAETSLDLSDSSLQNGAGIIWIKSESGLENDASTGGSVNEFSLQNQAGIISTNECSSENHEDTGSDTVAGSLETRIEALSSDNSAENTKDTDWNMNRPCFETQAETNFRLNEASLENPKGIISNANRLSSENDAGTSLKQGLISGCSEESIELTAHSVKHMDSGSNKVLPLRKKTFINAVLSEHHIDKHPNEGQFVCPQCSKTFKTKQFLNAHVKETHGKEMLAKELLAKETDPKEPHTKEMHVKEMDAKETHVKDEMHVKEMDEKGTLVKEVHAKEVHAKELHAKVFLRDPKPYTCDLCSARFRSLVSLRRHHITNTSEKPLSCPKCPETFMFKELLRLHLEKHVNE